MALKHLGERGRREVQHPPMPRRAADRRAVMHFTRIDSDHLSSFRANEATPACRVLRALEHDADSELVMGMAAKGVCRTGLDRQHTFKGSAFGVKPF